MKFLKNEEIVIKEDVFEIVIPGRETEGKPKKIGELKIYLDQLDSSTQALILGKFSQCGNNVQKRVDFVVYLLRNVINKVIINKDQIFKRQNDDETKTLNYIATKTDLSDNPSTAIFFAIGNLVANSVKIEEDEVKK